MPSVLDIARYFLKLGAQASGEAALVSSMKLQKLIYYAQGHHLSMFGTPLFPEPIEAWRYGPVVGEVYRGFKGYGSGPIPGAEGLVSENIADEARLLLDDVFVDYAELTALQLSRRTHGEIPWTTTWDGTWNKEIPQKLVQEYFGKVSASELEDLADERDLVLRGLLAECTHLPDLIHFARRELDRRFGPNAQMTLRGRVDPEEGDRYAVLYVQTSLPSEKATPVRDAFDEQWWHDREGLGSLVINFELV